MTRSRLLPISIILFLFLNLALLLFLWSKNGANKKESQHQQYLSALIKSLQDTDNQLSGLYLAAAEPLITSTTFLNTEGLKQRTALYAKISEAEETEKKALTALGRSFALLSLLTNLSNSTNPLKPLLPALESYLDEAQKTLVLYQWLTASDKALKPLLDFLTTSYLALGRGFYPAFVREDLSQYRQVLKGLSAQPYPANLPFASGSTVESHQKIVSALSTAWDQMAPLLATRTPENVDQLKTLLLNLDASLTKESSAAKLSEKDFWAANLQLQKSAYLLEQLQQILTITLTDNR